MWKNPTYYKNNQYYELPFLDFIVFMCLSNYTIAHNFVLSLAMIWFHQITHCYGHFKNICDHGLWHVMLLYLAFNCLDVDSLSGFQQQQQNIEVQMITWKTLKSFISSYLNCQRTLLTFKDNTRSSWASNHHTEIFSYSQFQQMMPKVTTFKKSFMEYVCYWTSTYFVQSSLYKYYKIDTIHTRWECPIKNLMNGNCNRMEFPSPNHCQNFAMAFWAFKKGPPIYAPSLAFNTSRTNFYCFFIYKPKNQFSGADKRSSLWLFSLASQFQDTRG